MFKARDPITACVLFAVRRGVAIPTPLNFKMFARIFKKYLLSLIRTDGEVIRALKLVVLTNIRLKKKKKK